jgi:hypothetical protein
MTAIRINFSSIAICFGLMFWTAPAHADYFSSWVATTCDPHSGRAIVRFGYADADDPPLFSVQAEPSFDGGMSAIPVTNASQEEATCRLTGSREVKIRISLGDPNLYFSIGWRWDNSRKFGAIRYLGHRPDDAGLPI